jgi:hypothetical protein
MIPLNDYHDRWRRPNADEERSNEAAGINSRNPLTLTLSPSEGAREQLPASELSSPFRSYPPTHDNFSLSPAEGERAGVRGFCHFI